MYIGARFLYRRRQFKVQFGSILLIIRDQDRSSVETSAGKHEFVSRLRQMSLTICLKCHLKVGLCNNLRSDIKKLSSIR